MKATFRLIVAVLLLSGWGLAASALHVVWTGDKPIVIPKDHLGARDTYVNVSHWAGEDVARHPTVVNRLITTGNADALGHLFKASSNEDLVSQIEDALARGPATQPADSATQAKAAVTHE